MRHVALLFIISTSLLAAAFSTRLDSVTKSKATATIEGVAVGLSGYVVRHFTPEHETMIARAVVSDYDPVQQRATLSLMPFETLEQDALPSGTWQPQAGDEVILGVNYHRGMLLAPDDRIYHRLVTATPSITWVHPDLFAAFISYEGHPTPIPKDIANFARANAVGLLYIYAEGALFTLDAISLKLLQITPLELQRENEKLPFYFRFERIDAAWFGEGSDRLESYDPHYVELLKEHNSDHQALSDYLATRHTAEKSSTTSPDEE